MEAVLSAVSHIPTPSEIRQAMEVMRDVANQLTAMDHTIVADQQLFFDMVDGESGNAMDIVRAGFAAATDLHCCSAGIDAEIARLSTRSAVMRQRAGKLYGASIRAIEALGLETFDLPSGTLRKQAARGHVIITNENEIPDQYMKVEKTPMKAEIAKAIAAKVVVPGATMSNQAHMWVKR